MPAPDLDSLYREHAPRLLRLAIQMTGERSTAEDALQDAFLSAFRARRSFRGAASPETWLYRIVLNAAVRQRERARKTQQRERRAARNRPTDAGDNDTQRARVPHHALDALTDADRAILGLLHLREIPARTVAQILGIPEGTVWSRAHAARQRLREALERADQPAGDAACASIARTMRSADPLAK
ncbi:MAG: sigma-70 family RNA polymerase sigma factor [Planctomycetota bacterium]